MHPVRQNARVLTASLVGTAVEFYDFYIYATAAALVIGPLFFPTESDTAQTLLAFMTFGLAFFARPIGAIAFGHFGDRIGRKSTLVASLMLMGGSTFLIAFLPTYAMVGWVAPALLCLLRFGQGFGLGGEWGGASLLAVENAPKGWEARFGSAPQLGAPLGFLCANGLFLLLGKGLSDADFAAWGWRVPFLASVLLVGLGLWVRLKIGETPAFREALEKA
ncbi:MAG: MFS transporter, partial [Novosphingobium sp.]